MWFATIANYSGSDYDLNLQNESKKQSGISNINSGNGRVYTITVAVSDENGSTNRWKSPQNPPHLPLPFRQNKTIRACKEGKRLTFGVARLAFGVWRLLQPTFLSPLRKVKKGKMPQKH